MDRKAEIDAVFRRALELEETESPAALSRFLDGACGDDSALRQAVAALLASSQEEDTLLHGGDTAASAFGALLLEAASSPKGQAGSPPDLLPGDQVGSFQITNELGRGGMAVVYRAERVHGGFSQEVALKVLQRGLVTEELLRRFEQERQILASLNHPHIASLLEGGITADGRPYFALEHIVGHPVDRYCDQALLPIEERLRLFTVICCAVHYAHGHLVVHRDLKPANILVSEKGEVKLLDFGIAKLLDPESRWGPAESVTRTAVRVMTPEYASPEQIRGEAVSTTADIYQLGLILYELLTGRRPHSLEGLSLLEAERLLEKRQPTRPSTAVTGPMGEVSAETRSHSRRTTPAHLRRRLKGDLDAIVLKALRLEPEQRYQSVDQLAADVERFLDGRAVLARRGNTTYRAGKFLRRHRLVAGSALIVFGSLAAYGWTATVQGRRIAQERDLARSEAAKAEEVKNFLVDLFAEVDPASTRGQDRTARELLDRGAERLAGAKLGDQPAVKAALLDTVGQVYRHLGAYPAAESALDEALALRRELARDTLPRSAAREDLAETLYQSGLLAQRRSDLETAESHFQEALAVLERGRQGAGILATAVRARLGAVIQEQGDYPAAEAQLRAALDQQIQLLGEAHPDVGESLTRLARVVFFRGRLEEAEAIQRQGVAALAGAYGADHPKVLEARLGVGFLRLYQGDHQGAEALLQVLLTDGRRVLGEAHPLVGTILKARASAYQDLQQWDTAEALYREAIVLHHAALGRDHAESLAATNDLGTMLLEKGDLAAAEPLLQEALAGNARRYGEDHPRVADNLYNLGTLYLRAGRYGDAEVAHRRCLAIRERVQDPGHLGIARSRATLGVLQVMAGKLHPGSDVEAQLRASIIALRNLGEAGEPHLPRPLTALGWVLLDADRPAEAEPLLKEALDRREGTLSPESRPLAESRLAYGKALIALGRTTEGRALVQESEAVLRGTLPEEDWLWRELESSR